MIYEDVNRYAETVKITEEKAEIICRHFLGLYKLQHQSSKCPKCGEHTLEIETGEFDELTNTNLSDDYVVCTNDRVVNSGEEHECGYQSEVMEEHDALRHWYTFDELLETVDLEMDDEERNVIVDRIMIRMEIDSK